MNYTMDASYRTRAARSLLKACDVKSSQNPDPSFMRKMAQISAKSGSAADSGDVPERKSMSKTGDPTVSSSVLQTADAVRIPAEDMTMEEYKEYIYGRISQLPVHPTNMQDYVSVQISEAGLEAMKNDPEYEQWVLDSAGASFNARDPWSGMCGPKYVILSFGAEKEQSRGESWRMSSGGNKLFNQKAKDGFWERRAQRRKELAEQYEEMLELKELNKDLDKGLYYGDLAILAAFRPKPVQSGMPQE